MCQKIHLLFKRWSSSSISKVYLESFIADVASENPTNASLYQSWLKEYTGTFCQKGDSQAFLAFLATLKNNPGVS